MVRNPYDRCVSLYHHRLETGDRYAEGKGVLYNFSRKLKYRYFYRKCFETWIKGKDSKNYLCNSAKKFICDSDGKVIVDDILRFEKLDSDISEFVRSAGLTKYLGRLKVKNISKNKAMYSSYYNHELRKIVEDRYSFEFDELHYERHV